MLYYINKKHKNSDFDFWEYELDVLFFCLPPLNATLDIILNDLNTLDIIHKRNIRFWRGSEKGQTSQAP